MYLELFKSIWGIVEGQKLSPVLGVYSSIQSIIIKITERGAVVRLVMSSSLLWEKRKNSNIFCFQAERQPRG
jgi:hypothetical protein